MSEHALTEREQWVVLTPPGVEVVVREAQVAEPQLCRVEQLREHVAALAKREQALRLLAEADAELGGRPPSVEFDDLVRDSSGDAWRPAAKPPERPADQGIDPESGQLHRSWKRSDPIYPCKCNQAFTSPEALSGHQSRCDVFRAWKLPGGTGMGEPGGLKWPGERSG